MLHALRLVQLQQTQPKLLLPPPHPCLQLPCAPLRAAAPRASRRPRYATRAGPLPRRLAQGGGGTGRGTLIRVGLLRAGRGRLACRLGLRAARRASMAATLDLLPMRACRARSGREANGGATSAARGQSRVVGAGPSRGRGRGARPDLDLEVDVRVGRDVPRRIAAAACRRRSNISPGAARRGGAHESPSTAR